MVGVTGRFVTPPPSSPQPPPTPPTNLRYHVPAAPQPHRRALRERQRLQVARAVQRGAAHLDAADAGRGQEGDGGDLGSGSVSVGLRLGLDVRWLVLVGGWMMRADWMRGHVHELADDASM
jgi:hypothetical protein